MIAASVATAGIAPALARSARSATRTAAAHRFSPD